MPGFAARFRNTLIFVAADEANLGTARDVMRKAMAWKQIVDDKRLHEAMTTSQIADAEDKARTNRDSAQKAVRAAWSNSNAATDDEGFGIGLV